MQISDKNIHVTILEPCKFSIPDTSANRKILYVLLRLLSFLDSKTKRLSYITISSFFGLKTRQDSNNFYRDFIDSGSDFLCYLERKVRLKDFFKKIEEQVLKYPTFSIQKHFETFKAQYDISISQTTFTKYFNQISCSKFKRAIEKWYTKNNLSIDKEMIINNLFEDYDLPNKRIIKSAIEEEFMDFKFPHSEKVNNQVDFAQNFSNYSLSILIAFFVACGLNFDVIKIIFGISKSTAWRKFNKLNFLKDEMISSVKYWSGIIAVDEKWVRVNKEWIYVLSAVDNKTGFLLYYHISKGLESRDWNLFFLRFKQLYGNPKLIISDGSKSLASGMKAIFPKVAHQLCKFHKLKNLGKRIYTIKDDELRNRLLKLYKGIFSNKTHFTRKRCLLKMIDIAPKDVKKYLINNIQKDWSKLTKSLTSNSAERWNRKIEKVVSKRYGIKTMKFLDMLIASLWMKEAIKNQTHLKSSFVEKIKLREIAKENVKMCNIIEFIKTNLLGKVA